MITGAVLTPAVVNRNLAFTTDGRTGHQRHFCSHAGPIQSEAGVEVIRAVDHQGRLCNHARQSLTLKALIQGIHGYQRIDPPNPVGEAFRL